MIHPFRSFIQNYTSMPDADWAEIEEHLEKKIFEKGDLLLREGEVCRFVYFLESGFLRYFAWKDGEDVSKFFLRLLIALPLKEASLKISLQEKA